MAVSTQNKIALGEKLHMARDNRKLSQRKAARAVEITNAALSDIENGHNFPSESVLLKLVSFYNPSPALCEEIYQIYSEAKNTPPPDISSFIKENTCLYPLLRELRGRRLTEEGLQEIRNQIQTLEAKEDESAK